MDEHLGNSADCGQAAVIDKARFYLLACLVQSVTELFHERQGISCRSSRSRHVSYILYQCFRAQLLKEVDHAAFGRGFMPVLGSLVLKKLHDRPERGLKRPKALGGGEPL